MFSHGRGASFYFTHSKICAGLCYRCELFLKNLFGKPSQFHLHVFCQRVYSNDLVFFHNCLALQPLIKDIGEQSMDVSSNEVSILMFTLLKRGPALFFNVSAKDAASDTAYFIDKYSFPYLLIPTTRA